MPASVFGASCLCLEPGSQAGAAAAAPVERDRRQCVPGVRSSGLTGGLLVRLLELSRC